METSLTPKPGLVVCYSYLWRDEFLRGVVEGRKDRPCAIVVALSLPGEGGGRQVAVVPITHVPPLDPGVALEIPARVKRHLGLDGERSWIMLNEMNVFTWPGFDLRPIRRGESRIDYGLLPPAFFDTLMGKLGRIVRERLVARISRDE